MKKNILTIVIMASSVTNLILTAILVFSVMPAMNKVVVLVDKVATNIDLEIESKSKEEEQIPVENLEAFAINYDTQVNINLQKNEGEPENHYAQIKGIVVSFDKEAEDFAKVKGLIETNTTYVEDIVKDTISSFTASAISQQVVKTEAIKKLQSRYDTKCIVDLSLPGYIVS